MMSGTLKGSPAGLARPRAVVLGLLLALSMPAALVAGQGSPTGASPAPATFTPARFLGDLGGSARALVSRENIVPAAIGTAGTLVAHAWDDDVRDYFSSGNRLGTFEEVGNKLGGAAVLGSSVAALFVAGQLQDDAKFRRFTYDLAVASVLNAAVTGGLKLAVDRTRPNGQNQASFPSGHTSATFTVATVVADHYGTTAGVIGYLTATFVGVSRLDGNQHFLSDVVAGAAIGYIVGRTVTRHQDRKYGRLVWTPLLEPGSRTAGVVVEWSFGE